MRSRDGRGRRRRGQRNASSWSSGCDDSAIEALFSAIGNGKYESQDFDEEVAEERRRRARDPAKRKSVTFAECQEVLEMSE